MANIVETYAGLLDDGAFEGGHGVFQVRMLASCVLEALKAEALPEDIWQHKEEAVNKASSNVALYLDRVGGYASEFWEEAVEAELPLDICEELFSRLVEAARTRGVAATLRLEGLVEGAIKHEEKAEKMLREASAFG